MGLIIGQVIGDLSCIGNLCQGINALGMWQPLDYVGEGCAVRCSKHSLCNCDNFSTMVVCHGCKSSVVEGVALKTLLAMLRSGLRNINFKQTLYEGQTARTCEELILWLLP